MEKWQAGLLWKETLQGVPYTEMTCHCWQSVAIDVRHGAVGPRNQIR